MTYLEAVEYLYARLPMFSRIGSAAIKKDLSNTLELCKRLGNPEKKFKAIHVGGTNGKGSVSHMLAAVLQANGYKTGLYTSPHLRDFRERIRINGEMIREEEVADFVSGQLDTIGQIEPSFFEVTVAMAFDHFARHGVDIAIIEVGLGGRLDSTNVITPVLSVITNIGYDHMNLLGNSLGEIAAEKAGIIKPGVPVVVGERQEEVDSIFQQKAAETGSALIFGSDEWNTASGSAGAAKPGYLEIEASRPAGENRLSLQLDLGGSYQLKNVKTVLAACDLLQDLGFGLKTDRVVAALGMVKTMTGLLGRWDVLSTSPLTICDTGHNEAGITEVVNSIGKIRYAKLHIVLGMLRDKDVRKVLQLLPKEAAYYFCQPDLPERAKPADELAAEAGAEGLRGKTFGAVADALSAARAAAEPEDLIFIGGSTFVVAEVV